MGWQPNRDKGGYNSKSEARIIIHQVNADGTELTSPDGYWDVGYVDSEELKDTTPLTPKYDCSGGQYGTDIGNREIKFSGTLGTRHKAVLDMAKQTRGNYYLILVGAGALALGTVTAINQEIFAFGQVTPQFDVKLTGGDTPFEFIALRNESAITISAASLTATGTAGWGAHATATVTIAAANLSGSNGYYTINQA